MRIIGIRADDREHGEFVLGALRDAVEMKRVAIADLALVTKDDHGKVHITQTHKFRHGIDDHVMKNVAGVIADGEAIVFALGEDAAVDAIAARVKELTGGDTATQEYDVKGRPVEAHEVESFTIGGDDEGLLREAAVDVPIQTSQLVRGPYS